jgi:hypothetical protein
MDAENRGDSPQRRHAVSTYQCETGESASAAVVRLVASYHDDDPATIDPPLYEAIDPDALDALFVDASDQWTRPASRIEFPYCGCEVEVRGDGRVAVRERSADYEG